MTTTYTTADNTRTAEHDEVRNTLTVFQGLNIISSLDVDADITPGEIWVLITEAKEPVVEVTETETTEFAGWFSELLDQILDCRDMDLFEREAYAGYIAYGASMTDGVFAPLSFHAWVIGFRKAPITELYHGNDARHMLAPMARSYEASLSRVTLTEDAKQVFKGPRNGRNRDRWNIFNG